jgi:hypothetical protein
MKRTVDSGTGVAVAEARLVLAGAVTSTLTVFAQPPKAHAQSGCPSSFNVSRSTGTVHRNWELQIRRKSDPPLAWFQNNKKSDVAKKPNTSLHAAARAASAASHVSTTAVQGHIKSIRDRIQTGHSRSTIRGGPAG